MSASPHLPPRLSARHVLSSHSGNEEADIPQAMENFAKIHVSVRAFKDHLSGYLQSVNGLHGSLQAVSLGLLPICSEKSNLTSLAFSFCSLQSKAVQMPNRLKWKIEQWSGEMESWLNDFKDAKKFAQEREEHKGRYEYYDKKYKALAEADSNSKRTSFIGVDAASLTRQDTRMKTEPTKDRRVEKIVRNEVKRDQAQEQFKRAERDLWMYLDRAIEQKRARVEACVAQFLRFQIDYFAEFSDMMNIVSGSAKTIETELTSHTNWLPYIPPGVGPLPSSLETKKEDVAPRRSYNRSSTAQVIYDYEPKEADELPLKRGSTVTILKTHASGWWEGELDGQTGTFPFNYVTVQQPMSPGLRSDIAADDDEGYYSAASEEDELLAEEDTPKRVEKRRKILEEAVSTERAFVSQIDRLKTLFLSPICESMTAGADKKIVVDMLCCVEDLSRISGSLIAELESGMGLDSNTMSPTVSGSNNNETVPDTAMGDVFLKYTRFFRFYSQYAHLYESLIEMVDRPPTVAVVEAITDPRVQQEGGPQLALKSLLIMPIQRIPRLKLLLESLAANTPRQHFDATSLKKAISMMKRVANDMNDKVRHRQQRERVFVIQKALQGSMKLTDVLDRVYLLEGPLTKICRKIHKRYHFFLFSDLLLYTSGGAKKGDERDPNRSTNLTYKLHRAIPLASQKVLNSYVRVEDVEDSGPIKNSFQIISAEKSFTVFADTLKQKKAWLSTFRQAVENLKNQFMNPDGTTQVSIRREAPVWLPDSHSPSCQLCIMNFTLMKRRHHCRRCGKVVCGSCSSHSALLPNIDANKEVRVCDLCYAEIIGSNTQRRVSAGFSFAGLDDLMRQANSPLVEGENEDGDLESSSGASNRKSQRGSVTPMRTPPIPSPSGSPPHR
eukprot:GILK01006048.1.p1 GENE.GILK01006048.1~~GILK01006048.1.p1  ORF type:complete len:905 (+),score=176.97 GILK01006048.1:32-2716(+)